METRKKKPAFAVYKISDLIKMMKGGQIRTRPVKQYQVREMKKYILANINDNNVYLPPIVASADKIGSGYPEKLDIIDGSKRLTALEQIPQEIEFRLQNDEGLKETYLAEAVLNNSSLGFQVYEGLSKKEQDQLFIDFNTKGKKVAISKRIAYDSRNDINYITNEIILRHYELKDDAKIEMEKSHVVKPPNKKLMSLSQLRNLVSIFIRGRLTEVDLEKSKIDGTLNREEYINLIYQWFELLFKCHPAKTIGNYEKTILAGYPMLLSICLYANQNLETVPFKERIGLMTERMTRLQKVDWKTGNEKWQTFEGARRGKRGYFYIDKNKTSILKVVSWLKSL